MYIMVARIMIAIDEINRVLIAIKLFKPAPFSTVDVQLDSHTT